MDSKTVNARVEPFELAPAAQASFERLLAELSRLDAREVLVVRDAVGFADRAHRGQWRKSGDPYIVHPIEVAREAAKLGLDEEAICAALLHDVVEDTPVSLREIEDRFGKSVADMVEALTKIDAIKKMPSERTRAKAETLRKMMLAMSRDVRVILVKLCDRLHNLRTIDALAAQKRRSVAAETVEIYAPIASRLGLDNIWAELMELSFQAKHPWRAQVIANALREGEAQRRDHVREAVERVKLSLGKDGIEAEVSGRSKRAESIYSKMVEKKLRFKDVLDKEGLRVVVSTKSQCYQAIGVLHELWKPIPGFFKDYVAIPKLNGYQSLHTALVNERGDPMEVQVRTREMHARAQDGGASHWVYKAKEDPKLASDAWQWMQSLLDLQASAQHAEDYLEHVRTDLFSDEVYVFTPSGEVRALPRGASVLDFAFAVHSDVGMRALWARVNGERSGLSRRLRSGDIVAVETSSEVQAKPMWLAMVRTAKAKSHVRAHLRTQELPRVVEMGSELVRQSLARLGSSDEMMEAEKAWAKAAKRFGADRTALLAEVGRGGLSALALAQVLAKGSKAAMAAGGLKPILIGGEETEMVTMARCCSPLPPQLIAGELTQDMGLSVHRRDCAAMGKAIAKGQAVELAWEEAALSQSFSASVKLRVKNERGALGRLAALIASMDADVNNVRVSGNSVEDGRAAIHLDLQVRSKFHLDRVMEALRVDPAVIGAS